VIDTPGTCDSGALLENNLKHISEFLSASAASAASSSGATDLGREPWKP
jgi:hypothetical protein